MSVLRIFLLVFYTLLSSIAFAQNVINIENTTWRGKDNEKDYEITFLQNGALRYRNSNGIQVMTYSKGSWIRTGSQIYIEINDKYVEKNGEISGRLMQGTALNKLGKTWSWNYELIDPNSAPPFESIVNITQPTEMAREEIARKQRDDKLKETEMAELRAKEEALRRAELERKTKNSELKINDLKKSNLLKNGENDVNNSPIDTVYKCTIKEDIIKMPDVVKSANRSIVISEGNSDLGRYIKVDGKSLYFGTMTKNNNRKYYTTWYVDAEAKLKKRATIYVLSMTPFDNDTNIFVTSFANQSENTGWNGYCALK